MNIWFFLKEYDPYRYTLKATKDVYTEFIKDQYGVEIKSKDKAKRKYEEKGFPTMNEYRIHFEESLSTN